MTYGIEVSTHVTIGKHQGHYMVRMSDAMIRKYDNGHLISIGLHVPGDAPYSTFNSWKRQGKTRHISREMFEHSGCQSECTLRGDDKCLW